MLLGERTTIVEIRATIHHVKNVKEEHCDRKIKVFFIKENEKDQDILHEATRMHETVVKLLWHCKIKKNLTFKLWK